MAHPDLLGPWFAGPTWATWTCIDKAIFGEQLTPAAVRPRKGRYDYLKPRTIPDLLQ